MSDAVKVLIATTFLLLASCMTPYIPMKVEAAPETVRIAALHYAKTYVELGAAYAWGGQDPLPRTISVDCSGLVVRCYGYACEDFSYRMPFQDMTAAGMQDYCDKVAPEPGDLIFMGDGGVVSHIAIFERSDGTKVYFIDSTDLVGSVTERSYPIASAKFIRYGRLRIITN
jgi:hypothetical protein